MSRKQKGRRRIRRFSKILSLIAFIVLVVFLIFIYKMNVLPMKYFVLIAGVLSFLEIFYLLVCMNRRIKVGILIFLDILAILFMLVEGYGSSSFLPFIYKTFEYPLFIF